MSAGRITHYTLLAIHPYGLRGTRGNDNQWDDPVYGGNAVGRVGSSVYRLTLTKTVATLMARQFNEATVKDKPRTRYIVCPCTDYCA